VRKTSWTGLDYALLVGAIACAAAIPVVRSVWIGPLLEEAIQPLEQLDARLPRIVMLGLSGYCVWGGLSLALLVTAVAAVVRTRASTVAGRALLSLALIVSPAAVLLDWAAVLSARAADPADFGVVGVTRCRCPASLLVDRKSACGCDGGRQLSVVLLDRDLNGTPETRCVCASPPSGEAPCALKCGPIGK